jgi:hypothetical protein
LADRIFDEILALRRPQSVVVELDDERDVEARRKQAIQNRVLDESVPVGPVGVSRRQLIVE